jgi:prepilin-type N-terminal cleavage/methylation domain-containing protein
MRVPRHYIELPCPPAWRWFAQRTTLGASRNSGFTLIELLLTVAVMAILAAILIPHISSDIPERLDAAAQVVTADLDYTRSLAVAHNSKYRVTFDPDHNLYYLRHSGTIAALNALPRSPFRQNDDAADQQTTKLSELPMPRPMVRLAAVIRMQSGGQATTEIEFTPLGATTSPQETVVWLACGAGAQRRYISVHVNPLTGLVETGPLVGSLPAAVETIATQNLAASEAALEAN